MALTALGSYDARFGGVVLLAPAAMPKHFPPLENNFKTRMVVTYGGQHAFDTKMATRVLTTVKRVGMTDITEIVQPRQRSHMLTMPMMRIVKSEIRTFLTSQPLTPCISSARESSDRTFTPGRKRVPDVVTDAPSKRRRHA